MKCDVVVVGAGFAGLACSACLAALGYDVVVLERKRAAGTGMHTTGILVKEATVGLDLPAELVKRIAGIKLYSPGMCTLEIETSDYFFLTTDTPALMVHFTERAAAAGAEIRFGDAYRGGEVEGAEIVLAENDLRCRWLIGADGPRSKVAGDFALGGNSSFLLGAEAEFEGFAPDGREAFHCFIDSALAPGYIGWVIPGVGITQVGLASKLPVKPDIDAFIDRISPLFDMSGARIVGRRGGLIPVGGLVSPFANGNVLLLGDAAGTVSPLTAGGIHTAQHYGERLARLIAAHERENGAHPAEVLAREYPRFRAKHMLRWIYENAAPDWALDAMIGSAPFRMLARSVFFRPKRLPQTR